MLRLLFTGKIAGNLPKCHQYENSSIETDIHQYILELVLIIMINNIRNERKDEGCIEAVGPTY